jgi:hypothetical protein
MLEQEKAILELKKRKLLARSVHILAEIKELAARRSRARAEMPELQIRAAFEDKQHRIQVLTRSIQNTRQAKQLEFQRLKHQV